VTREADSQVSDVTYMTPVAYKRRINVNRSLMLFLLAAVISYSSGVQQPPPRTAAFHDHQHAH
jgi:hypothetical protein